MTETNSLATGALAIAVISSLLLTFGGIKLMRRQATRKRGYLMLGAAAVLLMNVMIWTV